MSGDPNIQLRFKFKAIKTHRYEFNEPEGGFDEIDKINYQTEVEFRAVPEQELVSVLVHANAFWEKASSPVIDIEVETIYQVIGLEDFEKDDEHMEMPARLATHFISLAVSTTRGILAEKTRGTGLEKFILPPMDVNKFAGNLSSAKEQSADKE